MYITVNDIIGEKRIGPAYPVQGKQITVVSMFSDNVQCWLKEPMKILLKMGEGIELSKGVYMDKEQNAIIRTDVKSGMDSCDYVSRTNKLENVAEMAIRLEELDNGDNFEDGKPSNTLFTYYVTGPEYSTHFESVIPQIQEAQKWHDCFFDTENNGSK